MFAKIRRIFNQFLSKSRAINNEPLNRISLIVIILIDIFILINVFTGLNDISRWYLSPSEIYPCYYEWQNYQKQTNQDKNYEIIRLSLPSDINNSVNQKQLYQQAELNHLGKVSPICLQYAEYQDQINNSKNKQTVKAIDQKQKQISNLKQANNQVRAQYDSTLIEKIAGQPSELSINQVRSENAKQELQQNNLKISQLEKEISLSKKGLVDLPESANFIAFIQSNNEFAKIEQGYQQASFWYPGIQFAFQSLFLLPLIFVALLVHQFSQRKRYGLIHLISWHLLVIFFIPLILKVFEFLQFGLIFEFIFDIISKFFGRLLFLISYIYILLIPLIGFGIIKFFQRIVLNPKLQAVSRVQKSRCVNCAKKIHQNDDYCPHCGYYQLMECENCHNLTYKHLPYCKHCGSVQNDSNLY